METTGQRLRRLRGAAGLTQEELAKLAGFRSQGGIGNIERDIRGYGRSVVNIARALSVTPEYLEYGTESSARTIDEKRPRAYGPTLTYIPLLENSASMGNGSDELRDDVIADSVPVSAAWLHQHARGSAPAALRLIHGYGDSMSPTFCDGDILLVDTAARSPGEIDGVYVLRAHDRLYIKRVRRRMDGRLEVSSDNPNVKTADVLGGSEPLDVAGRVIWVWNGRRL